MKISQKLMALIALAALAIVLLTAVNYSKFQDVQMRSQEISDDAVPSVVLIGEISLGFATARRDVLGHIIETDTEKMKVIEAQLNEEITQVHTKIDAYRKYAGSDAGKQNIAELEKQLATWESSIKEVIHLSNGGSQDAAQEVVRNKVTPIAMKVFEQLNIATKRNLEGTDAAKAAINNSISAAISISVGLGIALIIAIIVIGLFIARSITNPLNEMRSFVVQLGNDYDFTRRLRIQNRDEIGESLTALNGLIDTLQNSLKQLSRIGRDVTGTATGLSTASHQLSATSQDVSSAASSMAAGLKK
ncbi:MCP four helix bundle domain-containing protein [Chitinibacter fontanus]|uniref:MCP four helix bundle domain-containing protein n=1 Tax=Chitinibacter fontanus TaxID=1737446 RepID=A0A7D5ZGM8_9NEIS|nr:MCP four helix bundle domain-containing protein [Chitinibacter fontanus]QLI81569.1 MCP four helix bundle domain-containing protein [Chitinibacter fontanus]